MADPTPRLRKLNASSKKSVASTFVPKLPPVLTRTMSNTLATATRIAVTTTPTVGRIWGSVTLKNCSLSLAPSMRAASRSSSGTALIAADRITIAKPVWIQMRMNIK